MLAIILLTPLLFAVGSGLGLSILAVWFIGRKKPWFGKNSLACFLGICLGALIWVLLITLIPVGPHNMEGYPAALLKALMLGMTPVSALPALMAYGPGKK